MTHRSVRIFSLLIAAFIPWLITLAAMDTGMMLPRPLFVILHYALVVLLFGVSFAMYYKFYKDAQPFIIMTIAMVSVFVFEVVYLGFFHTGEIWFLNYIDWIVPMFFIASTIYFVGKLLRK